MPPWKVTSVETQKILFELIWRDVPLPKEQREASAISIISERGMCVCVDRYPAAHAQVQWSQAVPTFWTTNPQFFTDISVFWRWWHTGLNGRLTFSVKPQISMCLYWGSRLHTQSWFNSMKWIIPEYNLIYTSALSSTRKGQICKRVFQSAEWKTHIW